MDATDLTGISVSTAAPIAAALVVIAAYAGLWAINKVIGIFRK